MGSCRFFPRNKNSAGRKLPLVRITNIGAATKDALDSHKGYPYLISTVFATRDSLPATSLRK